MGSAYRGREDRTRDADVSPGPAAPAPSSCPAVGMMISPPLRIRAWMGRAGYLYLPGRPHL